jgi:hypothetical protein
MPLDSFPPGKPEAEGANGTPCRHAERGDGISRATGAPLPTLALARELTSRPCEAGDTGTAAGVTTARFPQQRRYVLTSVAGI